MILRSGSRSGPRLGEAMSDVATHAATSPRFKDNAKAALADADLQNALKFVEANFIARRREVADKLPEFEALRDCARDIKDHTLAHLDLYITCTTPSPARPRNGSFSTSAAGLAPVR